MHTQMIQAQLMAFVTETKTISCDRMASFVLDDQIRDLTKAGWSLLTPPTPCDDHSRFSAVLVKYSPEYTNMVQKAASLVMQQLGRM